jgi:Fur family ferric uptake transcriptional regulator
MTPPREEELFVRFLRTTGLRMTEERRALLRAIFAQHRHIDADEVIAAVRASGRPISRATVYRNLELLVRCGLVHQVRLPGRRVVYEHLHPGQRHDHLSCRRCGRIVEFVSPGITALLGEICRAHGFETAEVQLQISARCRDCAGEAERAEDGPHRGAVAHA